MYVDGQYYIGGAPSGIFEPPKKEATGLPELIQNRAELQKKLAKGQPALNIPEFIVVHISDSKHGTARLIRQWHLERGFKDIGYNYVILNGQLAPNYFVPVLNGSIEVARWWEEDGAHAIGYNSRSISICGIGKDGWTPNQELSLIELCKSLMKQHNIPAEKVIGHCETESGKKEGKTCPNLDMDRIRKILKGEL